MQNFTIYRDGNYDYKANAALKAGMIGQAAGKIAIKSLKASALATLNGIQKIQGGEPLTDDDKAFLHLN